MPRFDLTRIAEHPMESTMSYLGRLPSSPEPGTRVTLDKRTLDHFINQIDIVTDRISSCPEDQTDIKCLYRWLSLFKFLSDEVVHIESFNPCMCN